MIGINVVATEVTAARASQLWSVSLTPKASILYGVPARMSPNQHGSGLQLGSLVLC